MRSSQKDCASDARAARRVWRGERSDKQTSRKHRPRQTLSKYLRGVRSGRQRAGAPDTHHQVHPRVFAVRGSRIMHCLRKNFWSSTGGLCRRRACSCSCAECQESRVYRDSIPDTAYNYQIEGLADLIMRAHICSGTFVVHYVPGTDTAASAPLLRYTIGEKLTYLSSGTFKRVRYGHERHQRGSRYGGAIGVQKSLKSRCGDYV